METRTDNLLTHLARSDRLQSFERLVSPLVNYDHERGGDLMRTLRMFFDCNGNASATADRLFLHRNSLTYRLQRIQELIHADLSEPRIRLGLQLALLHQYSEQETDTMQISTRNRMPGIIQDIVKDGVSAKITLKVGDNHIVSVITRESCDELGLAVGQSATALVKASDVMILDHEDHPA